MSRFRVIAACLVVWALGVAAVSPTQAQETKDAQAKSPAESAKSSRRQITREELAAKRKRARALNVIRFQRTPEAALGRFAINKPAEEIVLRRIGDSVTMWVTVNYLRRDISCRTQTRVTLSRKEWDPLIELIVQQDLLTWKPDSASQGFTEEGGITGFALTGAGEARNQQSWIGLIENRTAPKALADALNQLAKEKVRRLPLHYINTF